MSVKVFFFFQELEVIRRGRILNHHPSIQNQAKNIWVEFLPGLFFFLFLKALPFKILFFLKIYFFASICHTKYKVDVVRQLRTVCQRKSPCSQSPSGLCSQPRGLLLCRAILREGAGALHNLLGSLPLHPFFSPSLCVNVKIGGEPRGGCWVFFLTTLRLPPGDTVSLDWLASVLQNLLSLPSQCWDYRRVPLDLASYVGVVALNSSPQVCTSTTEPSPQLVAGNLADKALSSSCGPCTIYVLVFLVVVCGTGDRAQGLEHAGQVLYC